MRAYQCGPRPARTLPVRIPGVPGFPYLQKCFIFTWICAHTPNRRLVLGHRDWQIQVPGEKRASFAARQRQRSGRDSEARAGALLLVSLCGSFYDGTPDGRALQGPGRLGATSNCSDEKVLKKC